MSRYRKLPVEIEAVELTWATWGEVCELIGPFPEGMRGVYLDSEGNVCDDFPGGDAQIGLLIPTLEGTMLARQGDMIIKGVAGEFYPCRSDIFAATYELVEDDQ